MIVHKEINRHDIQHEIFSDNLNLMSHLLFSDSFLLIPVSWVLVSLLSLNNHTKNMLEMWQHTNSFAKVFDLVVNESVQKCLSGPILNRRRSFQFSAATVKPFQSPSSSATTTTTATSTNFWIQSGWIFAAKKPPVKKINFDNFETFQAEINHSNWKLQNCCQEAICQLMIPEWWQWSLSKGVVCQSDGFWRSWVRIPSMPNFFVLSYKIQLVPLCGNEWQWVAMSGNEWQWVAMNGNEWQWMAMNGNEWQWVAMSIMYNEWQQAVWIFGVLSSNYCRRIFQMCATRE